MFTHFGGVTTPKRLRITGIDYSIFNGCSISVRGVRGSFKLIIPVKPKDNKDQPTVDKAKS